MTLTIEELIELVENSPPPTKEEIDALHARLQEAEEQFEREAEARRYNYDEWLNRRYTI